MKNKMLYYNKIMNYNMFNSIMFNCKHNNIINKTLLQKPSIITGCNNTIQQPRDQQKKNNCWDLTPPANQIIIN